MSEVRTTETVTISRDELENLIRRVVREELIRLLRQPTASSILEDWNQEGSDDPAGDAALLAEALAVLKQYEDDADAWTNWETFKAELARAEAAGELPD